MNKEALNLVLEALKVAEHFVEEYAASKYYYAHVVAIAATEEALAQAQRTWVGLDPEEIRKTEHHRVDGAYHYSFKQGAEWAEAKLKEKNT